MLAYSKSRLDVAKAINSMTADTPLFECAGDIGPGGAAAAAAAAASGSSDGSAGDASSSSLALTHVGSPTSYAAIHLQLHKKTKIYHDKYVEHILTYVTEWERILTNRISTHLKQANKLRVDLDHYQRKVEDLQQDANKTMGKGKTVSEKDVDKLKRNENKLISSKQDYNRFISDLCGFMEEVMDRGWKDLHPLLVKLSQFDATLSSEEASCFKSMYGVTEKLKELSSKYSNVKAGGRLKELETWSLSSLVQASGESGLMIEDSPPSAEELGVGGGGLFGQLGSSVENNNGDSYGGNRSRTNTGDSSYGAPPSRTNSGVFQPRSRNNTGDSYNWNASTGSNIGSTTIAPAPSSMGLPPIPRGSSFHGNSSNPDLSRTSNMLAVAQSAAPPPTLDDIFGSTTMHSGNTSSSMGGGNDYASSSSFAAPPPVGCPPPPPSMPPPPPPQPPQSQFAGLSMYNNGSSSGGGNGGMMVPSPIPTTMTGGHSQFGDYSVMSPSNQSTGTSSTNPFDGGGGGGASYGGGGSSYGGGIGMISPMGGGGGGMAPPNNYQQGNANMMYGGNNYNNNNMMGGRRESTSSNPFE